MSHRRNLAPSTMDPTTKKHSSSSNPTNIIKHQQHPNPIPFSTLHKLKPHFPKPNIFNSTHIPTPSSSLKSPDRPRVVDIHLQAKSLTLSANADSSYLLKKPHSHQIRHQQPQQQKHPMEAKQRSKQGIEKKIKPRQGNRDPDPEPEPEPELVEDIDLKLSCVSLNGGRRKSWSDSKIELGDFFFNLSARVVSVDMPPFMQIHAVSCARKVYDSFEKASSSKTLASTLKKEFDGVYGPAWHCIVGTSFGSFVTHSVNGFFYFSLDHKLYILLFKTTVQRAA